MSQTNFMNQSCAFLFDLDGVLVDTARFHYLAWRRLANQLGFEFTVEQNEALKGISRMESLEIVLGVGKMDLSPEEKVKYAAEKNEYYLQLCSTMTPDDLLPGVAAFITEARAKGIKIGLGSASKNAGIILDSVGIRHFFDTIVDGNRIQKSKPDPEVFLLGAKDLELSPETCVVFEDAVAGIEAAQRAGMKTVGVGDPEILVKANIVIPGFEGISVADIMADICRY